MAIALTLEEFSDSVPPQLRSHVTQELVDQVNGFSDDPTLAQSYIDNVLEYTPVLGKGKFKLVSYLNSVMYVTYYMIEDSKLAAYKRVFRDKVNLWNRQGKKSKDIAAYVTAFHKSKLVTLMLTRATVPIYLANSHHHAAAIQRLVFLMSAETSSPAVQKDAAIGLLAHIPVPTLLEEQTSDSTIAATGAIDKLTSLLDKLGDKQITSIIEQGSLTEFAKDPI